MSVWLEDEMVLYRFFLKMVLYPFAFGCKDEETWSGIRKLLSLWCPLVS